MSNHVSASKKMVCRGWPNVIESIPDLIRINNDQPESETYTGELIFVDSDQKPQTIADVGRVTFSEGVRMASQIFAKRKVEKQEGAEA